MPAAVLLSSHSELDPPLPIPNRAVKRLSADDSADYPCESRTLLGSLSRQAPVSQEAGAFAFVVIWTDMPSRRPRVFRGHFQIERYFAKIKALFGVGYTPIF